MSPGHGCRLSNRPDRRQGAPRVDPIPTCRPPVREQAHRGTMAGRGTSADGHHPRRSIGTARDGGRIRRAAPPRLRRSARPTSPARPCGPPRRCRFPVPACRNPDDRTALPAQGRKKHQAETQEEGQGRQTLTGKGFGSAGSMSADCGGPLPRMDVPHPDCGASRHGPGRSPLPLTSAGRVQKKTRCRGGGPHDQTTFQACWMGKTTWPTPGAGNGSVNDKCNPSVEFAGMALESTGAKLWHQVPERT